MSDKRATVESVAELKTMNVREFVRGGYREMQGPTAVVNGGEIAFVAFPGTSAIANVSYNTIEGNGTGPAESAFRPVPKPSRRKR